MNRRSLLHPLSFTLHPFRVALPKNRFNHKNTRVTCVHAKSSSSVGGSCRKQSPFRRFASFSYFLTVKNGMSDKLQVEKCSKLLQAIAEPNRIRIIECLWDGSKNVTELATLLDVKIVNVSHHLGVLRSAGLVRQEKKGRFVVYSLHPEYFNTTNNAVTNLDLGWCQLVIPRT